MDENNEVAFPRVRCERPKCPGSCEGEIVMLSIPKGSMGPIIVRIDRAAEAEEQRKRAKLERLLALPDETIERLLQEGATT